MEPSEQSRRWETAQEHHRAAEQLRKEGFRQASASRSYYACFQAMWVAIGDPPLGHWKHVGLMRTFSRGGWTGQLVLPATLTGIYKKLLTLYDLRLDADYRALPIDPSKAQEALDVSTKILNFGSQHITLKTG